MYQMVIKFIYYLLYQQVNHCDFQVENYSNYAFVGLTMSTFTSPIWVIKTRVQLDTSHHR